MPSVVDFENELTELSVGFKKINKNYKIILSENNFKYFVK